MKYLNIWLSFAKIRLLVNLGERWAAVFFVVGKFIRFGVIGILIVSLSERVGIVSGYTQNQLMLFYLIFNFLDLTGQFFFRGIYLFRQRVLSGLFDRDLLYPSSALFISIMTHLDFLDIPLWLVTVFGLVYLIQGYPGNLILLFSLLLLNGLVIVAGLHIVVAALTILFSVGDQLIHIYRDFSGMARFPIDIYALPVRIFLNTLLPIGVAFSLPARALFGVASIESVSYGIIVSLVFLFSSLWVWKMAVSKYSSASS